MKNIIFSITCHENYECVEDLIINIKYFSRFFKCYILLSLTENLKNNFNNYILNDNVYIVSVRSNNSNIWGKIDLFHQHILNHKFTIDNNISYDYFWFVASNEYFVKDITKDFLKKNVIKKQYPFINSYPNQNYNNYYTNFMNSNHEWTWYKDLKKDKYAMNFIKNEKIYLSNIQHEGIVLDSFLMNEIYHFYLKSKINENSTFRSYCLEEIIISSYIKSRYSSLELKRFCNMFIYNGSLMEKYNNNDYEYLYNEFMNDELTISVKAVKRVYDDRFRIFLRDKMNNKKNNFILNQYKLNNNVRYYSHNNKCNCLISNNIIHFIKFRKGAFHYAWFGYNLINKGTYKINFDIETNKNINNLQFIKTHKPEKTYKINQNIIINKWNYIELEINIDESDLLVFIFDNYIDDIHVKIKNLTIN